MGTSIALVRAEVDREIARMARISQVMDERSALTRTLAEEARARLAAEKLAQQSEKVTQVDRQHDILEEGSETESMWRADPQPARQAWAREPPDEASAALQECAASPERAGRGAALDGWDAPQRRFPLPAWPSLSGLHSPSVPVRGAAVETDTKALVQGRRSGFPLRRYRVLRTCRVRRAAELGSEICGTLEPGRVIEVVARRTLTVSAKQLRGSTRRRGSCSSVSASDAANPEQPTKVVRLQFHGGWVSECTASRGLRSLQKLSDSLSTTQPRRQPGVGRHTAERGESSFYCRGVHHSDVHDSEAQPPPDNRRDNITKEHRKGDGKLSPRRAYVRPSTPLSPSQARRLGMPMTPAYGLADLQAGAWRSLRAAKGSASVIDPQRLEMSLSNDAFEAAFGMSKVSFGRLPGFERERRKKILLLTSSS